MYMNLKHNIKRNDENGLAFINKRTNHPQLNTLSCDSENAVVWSAPQVRDTISSPSKALNWVGDSLSSASPCPSCPSSPLPHEQTIFPADTIKNSRISDLLH